MTNMPTDVYCYYWLNQENKFYAAQEYYNPFATNKRLNENNYISWVYYYF